MTKAEFEFRVMDIKSVLFSGAEPDQDVAIPHDKAELVHQLYVDCTLTNRENE